MFCKFKHLCLIGTLISSGHAHATTADASVIIHTANNPKNILMPESHRYKKEMRKIAVAYGLNYKLGNSPLVRVKIKCRKRKIIPSNTAKITYLPFSHLVLLKKHDVISLPSPQEHYLEMMDGRRSTFLYELGQAALIIKKRQKNRSEKQKNYGFNPDEQTFDDQQRMLNHYAHLNAQRERRMQTMENAKNNTNFQPIATTSTSVALNLPPSSVHHHYSESEQRLVAFLEAQSDDDDHDNRADESGYSTDPLLD